jgi:hypothetical protein
MAPHYVEVVGDQQNRHAQLLLQAGEQFQDLFLNSDIERGGGLVGDQQLWLIGQRLR